MIESVEIFDGLWGPDAKRALDNRIVFEYGKDNTFTIWLLAQSTEHAKELARDRLSEFVANV